MITPSIVLVNPQLGENIGAAARAMLNFGLTDLRIVNPRDGWPNDAATANASGAFDIMPAPQIFDTLADALEPFHTVYATTARPRDMVKRVFTPDTAAQDMMTSNKKSAILFGAERTGLTNDEITQAHHIISIPVNPEFWSLNLAQSVLLLSHEIHKAQDKTIAIEIPHGDSAPASHEELNAMLSRLENELEDKSFFRSQDLKPTMIRNIRNIFTRSDLTEQEVRTFQGIISALIGNKGTKTEV